MQRNSLNGTNSIDLLDLSLLESLKNSSEDLASDSVPNLLSEEWQLSESQQRVQLPSARRSRRQTISDYMRRKHA